MAKINKSPTTEQATALRTFREAFNDGVVDDTHSLEQIHENTNRVLSLMKTQAERDYVLSHSTDPYDVDIDGGNSPLHIAAKLGDTELAKILVTNGAQLNDKNDDGKIPKDVAINGWYSTHKAKTYLSNDSEVANDQTKANEARVAEKQAETKRTEALRLAEKNAATPVLNPTATKKKTAPPGPIPTATKKKTVPKAAAVNPPTVFPPLSAAASKSSVLPQAKVNPTVEAGPNPTATHTAPKAATKAASGPIPSATDTAPPKPTVTIDLAEAAANQTALVDFKKVFDNPDKTYIEDEISEVLDRLSPKQRKFVLSQPDKQGNPPLHSAILDKNQGLVDALMFYEANVNAQNLEGNTALHLAALNNHQVLAKTLINNRADVNIQNLEGNTALHFTSKKGRVDLSKLLVDSGADISLKNGKKETAEDVADITTTQWFSSYNPLAEKTTRQLLEKAREDQTSAQTSVNRLLTFHDRVSLGLPQPAKEHEEVGLALKNLETLSETTDFQKNPQAYLSSKEPDLDKKHDRLVKLQTVLNAQLGKGEFSIHDTAGQTIDEGLRGTVTQLADRSSPREDEKYLEDVERLKKSITQDTGAVSSLTGGKTKEFLDTLRKTKDGPQRIERILKTPLDLDGNTALHTAAIAGNVSLSAVLVNNGAVIDHPNFYGKKPAEVAQTTQVQDLNSLNPVAEKTVAQYLNEIEANRELANTAVKTLVAFHDRVNNPDSHLNPKETANETKNVTEALNNLKKLSEQKSRAGMLAGGDVVALDFERNPTAYLGTENLGKLQEVIAGQKGGTYQQPELESTNFTALGTAIDSQAKLHPQATSSIAPPAADAPAAPKKKLKSAMKKPAVSEAEFDSFVDLAKDGKLDKLRKTIEGNPNLLTATNKAGHNVFQVLADIDPSTPAIEGSTELLLAQLDHHQKKAKEEPELEVAAAAFDPNSLAPTFISSTSENEEEKKRKGILVNPRNYDGIKADLKFDKDFTGKSSGSNTKTYHDADGKGQVIETMVGEKFTFEPGHPSDSPSKVYRIEVPRLVNGEVNENVCDVLVFNSKGMLLEHIDPDPGGKKSECRLDGEWLSKKLTEREKFLAQEQASSVKVSSSTPSKSGARIISSTNAPTAEVVVEEAAEKGSTTQNGKPNSAVNHSTTVSTAAKRSTPQNGKPNSAVNHSTTVSTAGGKKVSEEGHHYGNSRVGRKGARKAREQADAEKQTMQLRSKLSGTVEHVPSGSSVHPSSSVINSKTADAKRAKGGKND